MSDEELVTDEAFDVGDGSESLLRGAARAAVLLTAAGIAGQVFTMARELFVADKIGVSNDLDALLVAAVIPVMFAGFLASGTAAAIIPSYLAAQRAGGRPEADRLLGATFTWTILIGAVLTAIVIAGAGLFVTITGPGLDEQARSVAIGYVPLLAPMLVFSAAGGLLAATFQVHDRMRSIALAWLVGPAVAAVLTIVLWDQFGLTALAISMTVQQVVIVVVLGALALRFSIWPPITLRAGRTESSRLIRHATPLTISASALQFNLLADRAVGTLITPGAVSALRYAQGIINIPLNAIGPAWAAAIYPALVRASLVEQGQSFGQAITGAMRYIMAMFVPISVATAALAPVIVEVAYGRGAFDERAAVLTAGALAGFAPLIVLSMANSVLNGAHNARQRGVFLMVMGFLDAILNAVLNVAFGLTIGVAGIALSTSVTMAVIQLIKAWRLGSFEEGFPLSGLLATSAQSLAASLIVAVPIALLAWNLPSGLGLLTNLLVLAGLALVGMVGYIGCARLLRLDEPWIRDAHHSPGATSASAGRAMSQAHILRVMYPASLTPGGAERQMLLLAEHLPRDRFDVSFVLLGGMTDMAREAVRLGATVHALGAPRRAGLPMPVFAAKVARRVASYVALCRRERYDIVDAWLYLGYGLAAVTRPVSRVPVLIARSKESQRFQGESRPRGQNCGRDRAPIGRHHHREFSGRGRRCQPA